MIVATAGHVDHGKTLLIKALTGVDADRLPEEKRRGMTIDLGFAYLPIGNGKSIGFVDVPGHERFIRNMLCGVSGIDAVLLTVAADDGPMPQTFEHLAILDLLGVRIGVVAITKVDRVTPGRAADVQREIATHLSGTTLTGARIFAVSAATGFGVSELKEQLEQLAHSFPPRSRHGNFRLPVDRCFNIAGAGLVVTGTVTSGSVTVGDQVRVLPADLRVRVRTIHVQNMQAKSGQAGERCAINLAGINLKGNQISRGDWIVSDCVPRPVQKFDGRLRILRGEQRSFAHWAPVHLHLGATDVTGRVALLDSAAISSGNSGLVQVTLNRPIGALHGDKFIIRDQSAQRTIGGGHVIDIFVPARGRSRPERLTHIAAMEADDDNLVLASLIEKCPGGLNLTNFAANRNLTPAESAALRQNVYWISVKTKSGLLIFSHIHWNRLKTAALQALKTWHRTKPNAIGMPEDRVLSQADKRIPHEVIVAALSELLRSGSIIREGSKVRLASHHLKLDESDGNLWDKILSRLEQSMRPTNVKEIANITGEDAKKVESLLNRAMRNGLVVKIGESRFLLPVAMRRLGEITEEVAHESQSGLVTAAVFRDRSGIGRNLAIEVLEFFDRIKFTRRVGNGREVLRSAADTFSLPDPNSDASAPTGMTDGKESHPGGAPGLQIR
jgi:selenocysteine-specific elongation factor